LQQAARRPLSDQLPPQNREVPTGHRAMRRGCEHPERQLVSDRQDLPAPASLRQEVCAMERSAGIDWGSQQHAVCVLSADGSVLTQFTVPHTAAGLTELVRRLARCGPPEGLRVGIEDRRAFWSTR
jgi:hypothetical protein